MAIIFSSGVEPGTFSGFADATGCSIVTTPVYAGTYAAVIPVGNALQYISGQSLPTVSLRQVVYLDALPAASHKAYAVLQAYDGNEAMDVHITPAGLLEVGSYLALTGTVTGTYPISAAGWYEISVAYDKAAGGILKVWVRSAADVAAGTPATLDVSLTHAVAGNDVTIVDGGNRDGASACNVYVDAIAITDTLTPDFLPVGGQMRLTRFA